MDSHASYVRVAKYSIANHVLANALTNLNGTDSPAQLHLNAHWAALGMYILIVVFAHSLNIGMALNVQIFQCAGEDRYYRSSMDSTSARARMDMCGMGICATTPHVLVASYGQAHHVYVPLDYIRMGVCAYSV